MDSGIDDLREKRGDQEITFDNVADHLVDYAERHPDLAQAIDDLARFLANVEDRHHEHERDPDRGIDPGARVPHHEPD
jgi:hypothetical protein